MRTLYLTIVPVSKLFREWKLEFLINRTDVITEIGDLANNRIIVRCHSDGTVNWEATGIYKMDELVDKKVQFKTFKTK